MFYGATVWDPVLICAQITCMQCSFYLSLAVFVWLFIGTSQPVSLHYLLDASYISVHSTLGWLTILSFVTNGLAGAALLAMVVERAKKCLDFSATVFIVHFFVTWGYGGFPTHLAWWVTMGISLLIMAVVGEWLCIWREMQEIPLSTIASRGRAAATRLENVLLRRDNASSD